MFGNGIPEANKGKGIKPCEEVTELLKTPTKAEHSPRHPADVQVTLFYFI